MHDIFSPEPDPLQGVLHPPSPSENEALRQSVYSQTRRVLRRRRRLRQCAYAVSLFGSFAAGLLAMWMLLPARRASKDLSSPTPLAAAEVENPCLRSGRADDSALAMEWTAFDSEDHRAELYRQAGDRYMEEENDPLSALRSYGNALDNGTEQDLAISTDDNWLLMAIKDARLKEKKDAK
jgi:hypothetical protein